MARTSKQTTSLWSVIENMQQRLEAEGLDRDVVDAAVTRGLEALLDVAPPVRRPELEPSPRPSPRTEKRAARLTSLWVRSRAHAKA